MQSDLVMKVGVAFMGVSISRFLKEKLAWAIDNSFELIVLFKAIVYTTKELKNKAASSLKQYCMYCCVIPSDVYKHIQDIHTYSFLHYGTM